MAKCDSSPEGEPRHYHGDREGSFLKARFDTRKFDLPSGHLLHSELERSTIFDGKTRKTHYFDWVIFNSEL